MASRYALLTDCAERIKRTLFDRMDGTAAATDRNRLLVNRSTARVTATLAAGPTTFSRFAFLDTQLEGSTKNSSTDGARAAARRFRGTLLDHPQMLACSVGCQDTVRPATALVDAKSE